MRLSPAHHRILRAIAEGWALKAHRDLEGRKAFQLHHPDNSIEPVEWEVAESLAEHGLIDSNKKFPAATYWLTERGRQLVNELSPGSSTN